jgi:hypothetical protein
MVKIKIIRSILRTVDYLPIRAVNCTRNRPTYVHEPDFLLRVRHHKEYRRQLQNSFIFMP